MTKATAEQRAMTARFRATRDFLSRAGWSSARVAEMLGVSESAASAYPATPDTVRWRAVPADRLARLRAAAAEEARAFLDEVASIIDEEDRDAA